MSFHNTIAKKLDQANFNLQSFVSQVPLQDHECANFDKGGKLVSTDLEHETECFRTEIAILAKPDFVNVIIVLVVAFLRTVLALE